MFGDLPFGLREVEIAPLTGDTPGTWVDLPVSRTLSFEDKADFEKLRGDDSIKAIAEKDASTEWQLESGGISLEAYAVLTGITLTTAGTTPNQVKTLKKTSTSTRPYFIVRGRAISDSGGDFECKLFKVKANTIKGSLKDGEFFITECSGEAVPNGSGEIWEMKQKETAATFS